MWVVKRLGERRNFALVEDATVQFAPGLNVITGESGSGKSVRAGPFMSKDAMQHAHLNLHVRNAHAHGAALQIECMRCSKAKNTPILPWSCMM